MYEDENDTYNYEKGSYATFLLSWNDSQKKLLISGRTGNFPGMLKERHLKIVFVKEGHGTGTGLTQTVDKSVVYQGKSMIVQF